MRVTWGLGVYKTKQNLFVSFFFDIFAYGEARQVCQANVLAGFFLANFFFSQFFFSANFFSAIFLLFLFLPNRFLFMADIFWPIFFQPNTFLNIWTLQFGFSYD